MKTSALTVLSVFLGAGLLLTAANGLAKEPPRHDETRKSEQPVDDTWITTKVKADLLATKDVSGLDIKVETVNGVVMLSGKVDSPSQIERAKAVAAGIKGVVRVDSSHLAVGP